MWTRHAEARATRKHHYMLSGDHVAQTLVSAASRLISTSCHEKCSLASFGRHASLIFYQSGYSLHTLRQASRRSWRIGQRQAVRVYYLHYQETMQSSWLRLMAKKMLVSLAMEGKFSAGEGLHSFEEDDDILTAMARELVTEQGIGEAAEAIWRQLQTEHSRVLPPPAVPLPSPLTMPSSASELKFGVRPPIRPSRRQEGPPPAEHEQFLLF